MERPRPVPVSFCTHCEPAGMPRWLLEPYSHEFVNLPQQSYLINDFAKEHDLIVMTDEIYSELRYDETEPHVSIASLPGMKERTILLHGFSKAFAMTGFRLGYACAPQPIIEAMMKIHQYAMLCAPIMSQNAAIEALEHGQPSMIAMRDSYHQRRDFLVKRLNQMGLECHSPGGAFYTFPDIRPTGLSSKDFAMRLLEEEGLYYFYKHEASAHRMIICDKPSSHRELPIGKLHYNPLSDSLALVDSKSRPRAGAGRRPQSSSWSTTPRA